MNRLALCAAVLLLATAAAHAQRAPIPTIAKDPYLGALVVDAATGKVLFEQNADATCFPASVVKLMDLLLILEDIERGTVKPTDMVTTTAEASNMGGSQVFLREHEAFSVNDLLYALMVQSANDAALALAMHAAGTKEGFVVRMNQRAKELGMEHTRFASVHGLPPSQGQEPDVSTPRDLMLLGRELLKHKETLTYTSTVKRGFRNDSFIMENHNNLLGQGGCDGLKTGYFKAGGYSIVATAARDGRRVIAVVVGSQQRQSREAATARLLAEGLAAAQPPPPPPPPRPVAPTNAPPAVAVTPPPAESHHSWLTFFGIVIGAALIAFGLRRRRLDP